MLRFFHVSSRIAAFYAQNCIFHPTNETASLSHNNQSDLNACFKKSIKLQENERHLYQLFTNQLNTGWIKYFCRWKKPYLNDWILRFQKAILVWFQITPIISDLTIHIRKFQHAQDLLMLIYPKLHSKLCDYLYSWTAWYPLHCLKRHIQNKKFWKVISSQVCLTTTTFVSCFHDLYCTNRETWRAEAELVSTSKTTVASYDFVPFDEFAMNRNKN